jgi:hypothetical protein
MSLKGNGLLQKGITRSGAFGPVTEEFLVDVSGASLDSVTIFIASRDAWIAQNGWLQVDMLEINTGSGGSGTLWRETFTGSIHMEKTDSTGDYGYLASGPPDFVIPEFPLGTISAIAAGLIALLIAGRRPRTFQRN